MKYPLFDPAAAPEAGAADILGGIDALPSDPSVTPSTPATPKAEVATPEPAAETPQTTPEPTKAEAPPEDVGEGLSKLRKPKETPKESAKPVEAAKETNSKPEAELKTPKQLREAYELTKKENADLQAKIAELAKAKEDGTKAEIAKAQAELNSKLESLQKKYEDNETRLRYVDYQQSDDFKEKHENPLNEAWQQAGTKLKGYTVNEPDGSKRPITGDDIASLVYMEPGAAHEKAEAMFGTRAAVVMRYVEKIAELHEGKTRALEDWKKKGSEWQAEQNAARESRIKMATELYESRQTELRKVAPELFEFNPEDDIGKEAKEYVESRERLNALAFRGLGLKDGITAEERMKLVTRAQADVAAASRILPYQILRAQKAEARVAELEKKLAGYRKTEPQPGGGNSKGGGASKPEPTDIVSGIDAIPAARLT